MRVQTSRLMWTTCAFAYAYQSCRGSLKIPTLLLENEFLKAVTPNKVQSNNLEGREKAFVTTQLFELRSWASVECQGSDYRNKRMGDSACKNLKVSQRFSQFYTAITVNSHSPHIGGQ